MSNENASDERIERLRELTGEIQRCLVDLDLQVDDRLLTRALSELPMLLAESPVSAWNESSLIRNATLASAALSHLVATLDVAVHGLGLGPAGVCTIADPSALVYQLFGPSGPYTICGHIPPHRTP